MATSRRGRPPKWPPGTDIRQVHIDVPAELAEQFKLAADARGLALVDWMIAVGTAAIGRPFPLPIQEKLPLSDAA